MPLNAKPSFKKGAGTLSPSDKSGKIDVIAVDSPKQLVDVITSSGVYIAPRIIRQISELQRKWEGN